MCIIYIIIEYYVKIVGDIMNFIYIKQVTNIKEILPKTKFQIPYFFQNLFFNIKKFFSILTLKDDVLILPIKDSSHISSKKWEALNKKINEFVIKNKISKVALSHFLNEYSSFKSVFYDNNIQILNGRWVFPFLSFDVLKYITAQTSKDLSQFEVAILTNHNTELINSILITLAKNVKFLTIVTKEPKLFAKVSKYLYEDFGIIIRVSNNKRKCLEKVNIVLNYDFSEYELNEYQLNTSSILVNFHNKVEILSKSFSGINVNFFEFNISDEFISFFKRKNLNLYFQNQVLLESLCLQNSNLESFVKTFSNYSINISSLIGNNGVINKNEFVTIFSQNRLDKNTLLT